MGSAGAPRTAAPAGSGAMGNESLPERFFGDQGLKLMLIKVGDWPLYSFSLAIVGCPILSFISYLCETSEGQIITANPNQPTLLTAQVPVTAERL